MRISSAESVGSRAVPANEDVAGRSAVLLDFYRCVQADHYARTGVD